MYIHVCVIIVNWGLFQDIGQKHNYIHAYNDHTQTWLPSSHAIAIYTASPQSNENMDLALNGMLNVYVVAAVMLKGYVVAWQAKLTAI